MKKLLVLDNYDSFTYNLVHLVEQVSDIPFEVHRNDEISLKEVTRFDKILLSPGPGIPSEAGLLKEIINAYGSHKCIMGVCLGLQAIAEVYGGQLENMMEPFHGVATPVHVCANDVVFEQCPPTFMAGRYHSWVVSHERFPQSLEVTATDEQGRIMALRHKTHRVRGVQFHPESILSEYGETLMKNWLNA